VTFEKEGYSKLTRFGFGFPGGKVPAVISNVNLIGLAKWELLTHSISNDGSQVHMEGTVTSTDRFYVLFYFGKDAQVSNESYDAVVGHSHCCVTSTSLTTYTSIPSSLSGPVYVVAYAGSWGNASGTYNYYDYEKQKSINSAVKKLFEPVKIR
jgi:hypothetical protein